uniref:Methyltransf_FA domain-containing protein n=1 Tax=Mesocestoides corti TaxID=53468 RepID=A0A5K3F1F2_MESCO
MFGVLVILTTCIASFTGVGVNGHFIVDTPSGCVDVAVNLPYEFSAVQVDHNRYEFDGNLTCSNMNVDNDYLECSLTLDPSGGFIAKVRVCDVENKVWVGFFVDRLLSWSHHAFVTAYFSHGGKWANINRIESYHEDMKIVKTVYAKPGGDDVSYVFCSTGDSFLSYAIDWANSGKLSSAQSYTGRLTFSKTSSNVRCPQVVLYCVTVAMYAVARSSWCRGWEDKLLK